MKFPVKDLCGKCEQIQRKLLICSHLLKKFLMKNFVFYTVAPRKNLVNSIKARKGPYARFLRSRN